MTHREQKLVPIRAAELHLDEIQAYGGLLARSPLILVLMGLLSGFYAIFYVTCSALDVPVFRYKQEFLCLK